MLRNSFIRSSLSCRSSTLSAKTRFATQKPCFSSYVEAKKAEKTKSKVYAVVGTIATAAAVGMTYQMVQDVDERRKTGPPKKKGPEPTPLDSKKFIGFPLKEVHDINYNTKRFTFELSDMDQNLGLPVASCIMTRIPKPEGEGFIIRPYTPISTQEDKGVFELLIKHYKNGPMSEHIFSMKKGDLLEVKGPILKFKYEPNTYQKIGMVAGGTGLTPMLQVIKHILQNPDDQTKVSLLFANQEERDILLKNELDTYAKEHPDRFQVHYTLDKPSKNWTGEKGFVSKEMIEKYMPKKEEPAIIFVCGPSPMMNHVSGDKTPDYKQGEVGGILAQLGYSKENVFKF